MVTSSPGGITCAGSTVNCTGWFAEGTSVTLTATPDPGFVFVNWVGCIPPPTNPLICTVTVNGPQSVVAHFATPLQYSHHVVLGSVRMITDAAGAVVIRHDYFAFGEDTAAPAGDPRRFTGKERDAETEQHYFGARYYRSTLGRFTSVDPHSIATDASSAEEFVAFLSNPQSWNWYAYVQNRPLVLTDPDGRCPTCGAVLLAPLAPVAAPAILTGAAVTTVVIAAGAIYENRDAIGRSISGFFSDIGRALGLKASSAEGEGDKSSGDKSNPTAVRAGDVRVMSDAELKRAGIDAHGLKDDNGGRKGNVAKDKDGNLYIVNNDKSVAKLDITIDQARLSYPIKKPK